MGERVLLGLELSMHSEENEFKEPMKQVTKLRFYYVNDAPEYSLLSIIHGHVGMGQSSLLMAAFGIAVRSMAEQTTRVLSLLERGTSSCVTSMAI
ncbi:hypothetical protein SBF1_3590003 [Candidatus Desulfosporosinus infrequens]|uniref:Uncharacterized protein n=1 Tax=Candidatus Desulfosporosinus infrequens TaxID=2043169 RepID=A0A2U3L3B3_9FIRM|nr:hypothetical protein SBF1_3590003 [Candidatus Desulfosporosinus infrequens]